MIRAETRPKSKSSAEFGLQSKDRTKKNERLRTMSQTTFCQSLEVESSVLDSSCGPLCPHARLKEHMNFCFGLKQNWSFSDMRFEFFNKGSLRGEGLVVVMNPLCQYPHV